MCVCVCVCVCERSLLQILQAVRWSRAREYVRVCVCVCVCVSVCLSVNPHVQGDSNETVVPDTDCHGQGPTNYILDSKFGQI